MIYIYNLIKLKLRNISKTNIYSKPNYQTTQKAEVLFNTNIFSFEPRRARLVILSWKAVNGLVKSTISVKFNKAIPHTEKELKKEKMGLELDDKTCTLYNMHEHNNYGCSLLGLIRITCLIKLLLGFLVLVWFTEK